MIQQDYIRRADDQIDYFTFREGDAIPTEDSAPCIDGAYISPAPDYQDMGNGFIKATVTAYGRVGTSGVVEISKRVGDYYVGYYYNKGGCTDIGFFKSQKTPHQNTHASTLFLTTTTTQNQTLTGCVPRPTGSSRAPPRMRCARRGSAG
jgi:hypothetical protein